MKHENLDVRPMRLNNFVDRLVTQFFEQPAQQQLEALLFRVERLLPKDDPLAVVLRKAVTDFCAEINASEDRDSCWWKFEERLFEEFDRFFEVNIQYFIDYLLVSALLRNESDWFLEPKRLASLKKSASLNGTGKLRKSLIRLVDATYAFEVSRGGRTPALEKHDNLELLSKYNRYRAVIKLARRQCKEARRKDSRLPIESTRRLIADNLEIPKDRRDFLYGAKAPAELALEWVKTDMALETMNDRYLSDVIANTRKEYSDLTEIIAFGREPYPTVLYVTNSKRELRETLKFTSPYSWGSLNCTPFEHKILAR